MTPAGDGLVPIRITDAGGESVAIEHAALAIEIDDVRVPSFEVASIEERIAILIDPSCLAESVRATWAAELARALAPESGSRSRALFLCGEERLLEISLSSGPSLEKEIARGLNESPKSRLYDGVLESIGRMSSTPHLPARIALVVVASGIENADSRHPVLTCIEAADSARVAVHALIMPASENAGVGERRLRELTGKSGGIARPGASRAPADFRALLESVEGVQVVRIPALGGARSRHSVRVLAPGASPVTGALAPRTSLGYAPDRPIPWMTVALGGFFVAGAVSLWVKRARPLGRLRVLNGAPPGEVLLTRRGITIGGAVGNGLVFDDPRVSRNHAMIQVKGSEIKLVDLKSSNGTKVNGARISSHPLGDGDRILLAEAVELVYESRAWRSGKPDAQAARPRTKPAFGAGDDDDDDDDNGGPMREKRT